MMNLLRKILEWFSLHCKFSFYCKSREPTESTSCIVEYQIKDLNAAEILPYLAHELFKLVSERRAATTYEQLIAWVEEDYEEGSNQFPSPPEVVARHTWDELKDKFKDWPIKPELVEGRIGMGLQKHWWYELANLDLQFDPLPRVFLIDPAPIGLAAQVIMVEPQSPFHDLYQRYPK